MNKFTIVDINNWIRKDNYLFFKDFLNSWYTVTSKISCTNGFNNAKERGESFFIYYLYSILKSANEIEEFRVRKDINGNIILLDKIDIITPISVPNKTFYTVRIPFINCFKEFYSNTKDLITNIPADGGPYDAEKEIFKEGVYDVIHLSAIPSFTFTSITFTAKADGCPAYYPLSIIGKAEVDNGDIKMPYSIYVDHSFIDGSHISEFFTNIESILNSI